MYKAIECLEDWAARQHALETLNLMPREEFRRLKQTANSFRHRPGKHNPPPVPVALDEGRQMLGKLIQCAFAHDLAATKK